MTLPIDLTGKRALVTGGSRGIGRAVSVMLARAGADVAVGHRASPDAAAATVAAVEEQGRRGIAFAADLTDPAAAAAQPAAVRDALGGLDVFVSNAGIWEPGPLEDLDGERLDRTFSINVNAAILGARAAAGLMGEGGRIVFIGSTAGVRGEAGYAQYAASKGAIHLFAKSIAVELAPRGITVNAVAPGWVDTEMTAAVMDGGGRDEIAGSIPAGRVADADDVAGVVAFLCSDLARHIVGAVIDVNGGSVRD